MIGTHNRHKTEEISRLLADLPIKIRDLNEFPNIPPVEEDGKTLLENSQKKAKTYGAAANLPCLADDTGLEVEALDGAPGVYSARYAGGQCSYADNCQKLLSEMKGAANRRAWFKTVISLYEPETGQITDREGFIMGEIMREPRGTNGFGYDPVFLASEAGKTFAEMSLEEKNNLSHRARAVKKMKAILEKKIEAPKI